MKYTISAHSNSRKRLASYREIEKRFKTGKNPQYFQKDTWRDYRYEQVSIHRSEKGVIVVGSKYREDADDYYAANNTAGIELRFRGFVQSEASNFVRNRNGSREFGWYTDHYQSETVNGVVFQIPARNRKEQYLAGYIDDCVPPFFVLEPEIYDDERDAARRADRLAQLYAEESREYRAKDQAEQDIETAKDSISELRGKIIAVCKEARLARRRAMTDLPNLCDAIRTRVNDMLDEIQKNRKIIKDRENNPWSAVEDW